MSGHAINIHHALPPGLREGGKLVDSRARHINDDLNEGSIIATMRGSSSATLLTIGHDEWRL